MSVECAFGILSSRWRMLQRHLILSPEMAGHTVRAVCVLHNILTKLSDHFTQSVEDNIHRLQQPVESQLEPLGAFHGYKTSFDASQVRMIFTRFFVCRKGAVPWQDKFAYVSGITDDHWMANDEPQGMDSDSE